MHRTTDGHIRSVLFRDLRHYAVAVSILLAVFSASVVFSAAGDDAGVAPRTFHSHHERLIWPVDNPATTRMSIERSETLFHGDKDQVMMFCYNCGSGANGRYDTSEYLAKQQFEWTFKPTADTRAVEWNFDFVTPGGVSWRPWAGFLDSTDETPTFKLTIRTDLTTNAFHINQNGNVTVGSDDPSEIGNLYVDGRGQLELGGTSGGEIIFEGATADANEIRILSSNPSSDHNITLPSVGGHFAVAADSAVTGVMFWGDGADASFDTGSEVCSNAGLDCDHTFDFGAAARVACGTTHAAEFAAMCSS